jgi:hypothetical protein
MLRPYALAASVMALVLGSVGCSISTAPPPSAGPGAADGDAGTSSTAKSKPKTIPKTSALKQLAGPTPPSGATSRGIQSRPALGMVSVPIEETEVFVLPIDFDGDGTEEQLHWAYAETGTSFLWVVAPMTCADGTSDAAGGFLMAVNEDGTGTYLFTLEGCSSSHLFGCDFDAAGNETTCGACSVEDDVLICDVSE